MKIVKTTPYLWLHLSPELRDTAPRFFLILLFSYTVFALFYGERFLFSSPRMIAFVLAAAYLTVSLFEVCSATAKVVRLAYQKYRRRQRSIFLTGAYSYHFELKGMYSDGVIYIVIRQADGIFKLGATKNFEQRLAGLTREYGPVLPVATWQVPNLRKYEQLGLDMTKVFEYREPRRTELRLMTDRQMRRFINDFTACIKHSFLTNVLASRQTVPRNLQ